MGETRPFLLPLTDDQAAALGAAADALGLLIRLYDREADAALIEGLQQAEAGEMFLALLPGPEAQAFAATLDDLNTDPATLDDLAADYADTFLTHGHRISPSGSVWLTEDRLERQEPMFEVRDWYAHYGITVPNWRLRADDHLVHELQFVEILLRQATPASALDAARFLDRHVLVWLPQFCAAMAQRCNTPLYAATGALSVAFLEALRDLLTSVTGESRHIPEIGAARQHPAPADEDAPFLPGAAESW